MSDVAASSRHRSAEIEAGELPVIRFDSALDQLLKRLAPQQPMGGQAVDEPVKISDRRVAASGGGAAERKRFIGALEPGPGSHIADGPARKDRTFRLISRRGHARRIKDIPLD